MRQPGVGRLRGDACRCRDGIGGDQDRHRGIARAYRFRERHRRDALADADGVDPDWIFRKVRPRIQPAKPFGDAGTVFLAFCRAAAKNERQEGPCQPPQHVIAPERRHDVPAFGSARQSARAVTSSMACSSDSRCGSRSSFGFGGGIILPTTKMPRENGFGIIMPSQPGARQ